MIFFDIDDTLLDHQTSVNHAVGKIHSLIESPHTLKSFQSLWSDAHNYYYPSYLTGDLSELEMRRNRIRAVVGAHTPTYETDDIFERYMEEYTDAWSLFPDVFETLERLSYSRLGIITNGPTQEQKYKLHKCRIDKYFEVVIVSEEVGHAKPEQEIFQIACESAGHNPHSCTYIGDNYQIDVVGASNAGMRGVHLVRKNGIGSSSANKISSLSEFHPT